MTIRCNHNKMWKTCLVGGWTHFSFFNQLSNLNSLSDGSVTKEYLEFVFSVSRQFGAKQVGILIVFLLINRHSDIRDRFTELSTGDVTRQGHGRYDKWRRFRSSFAAENQTVFHVWKLYWNTAVFIYKMYIKTTFIDMKNQQS